MYPGVLYSDTVIRWKAAFDLFAGKSIGDTNPVTPFIWMRLLHAVTGEVGIVTVLQAFVLALGVFRLIQQIVRGRQDGSSAVPSNVASILVLVFPLQIIYSVFQTFDTPAAAIMLWLSTFLIRLWQEDGRPARLLMAISGLLFFLVAYRLPALPVALIVLVLAFGLVFVRTSQPRFVAGALPVVALLFVPFAIGPALSVQSTHLWIGGSLWRYMLAAPQSQNPAHEAFLKRIEGEIGMRRRR